VGEVFFVDYDRLVESKTAVIDRLADFCGLQPLEQPRKLQDRPAKPGKGLRNVVDGRIHVIKNRSAQSWQRMHPEEITYIQERLWPLYTRLQEM
jgi:hypothetical protein